MNLHCRLFCAMACMARLRNSLTPTLTRRGALAALGADSIAAGITAAEAASLDWNDPAVRLDAIIRMTGRTDTGIAVRWTDGILAARIDAQTTPLFRALSQIYSRHRKRADGGYDAVIVEIVYFVDLITRELLETWRNPFTSETVPVPQMTLGPTSFVVPLSLVIAREPAGDAGARPEHRFDIEGLFGGDVWITERNDSITPPLVAGAPPFGFHENFTFHASQRALSKRTQAHVPTVV
ncbi:MAG: DUF1838 domain-containing protein [Rhodospirillaceae bacterium]|nr:DUF1838 domain-containing protein [Rhodospirillaceae bacterium]